MKRLTRIGLGSRLAFGFGLMVLMLIGIVVFAVSRQAAQNDRMEGLVGNEVGSLIALLKLESQAQATGVALRDSVLADKSDLVKAALARAHKLLEESQATIAGVEAVLPADEQAAFAAVKTSHAGFAAASRKVAETMKGGDNDAARGELVSAAMVGAQKAYFDALTAMVTSQRAETERARADGAAAFVAGRTLMIGLAVIATLLAVTLAALIVRSVLKPIRTMIESAQRIAGGDLVQDLHADGGDEVSQLMQAMQSMQESLRRTVTAIRDGASHVQTASAEIAQGNLDLSTRTERQSSSLQETASSMAQMSSALQHSAQAASQANQLASSAYAVAARGGEVVSQVVTTMSAINDSSRRISDIIGTIDGIAFQTNILALNAAVEAARAGEQGRGFAVVAGEVRTLAQRSAAAAREIKALIGDSVGKIESGAKLVKTAGETMGDIVGSVRRVSDIIAEITAATEEQTRGIGEVNGAVGQLDEMTQHNASLVEQSAAAAGSLQSQASRLMETVGTFRLAAA